MTTHLRSALFLVLLLTARVAAAQEMTPEERWAVELMESYGMGADVVYHRANGRDLKLDVYVPSGLEEGERVPTVIYIHGGGWVFGAKEGAGRMLLPYLARGWAAVNVEYRMAGVSHAPAAVEDARCALRWVVDNAEDRHFDTDRIVVTGHSAGGHLSLTTGLLDGEAGLDRACPGSGAPLDVAAVVNWYGITDVVDLLDGPNMKTYAVAWLGAQPGREAVARRVSPLEHVDADAPPVITIHGDADSVVPFSHAVRLHERLEADGVPNRLVTIEEGGHGGFTLSETLRAYGAIYDFLDAHLP